MVSGAQEPSKRPASTSSHGPPYTYNSPNSYPYPRDKSTSLILPPPQPTHNEHRHQARSSQHGHPGSTPHTYAPLPAASAIQASSVNHPHLPRPGSTSVFDQTLSPARGHGPHSRQTPGEPLQEDHHRRHSMDHPPHYTHHGAPPTLYQHLSADPHANVPHHIHAQPGPIQPHLDQSMQHHYPPPHHPLPPGQIPYDAGQQYGPYYGEPSGGPGSQQRRKAVRAAQACDNCRTKKAKCDEARPGCGNCVQTGANCIYRSLPPPKADRSIMALEDRIEYYVQSNRDELQRAVNKIVEEFHTTRLGTNTPAHRLAESAFHRQSASGSQDTPPYRGSQTRQLSQDGYDDISHQNHSSPNSYAQVDYRRHSEHAYEQESKGLPSPKLNEHNQNLHDTARKDMLDGYFSIPPKHTTGAHHLRREWPDIESFFVDIPMKYIESGESQHHLDLSDFGSTKPSAAVVEKNSAVGSRGTRYTPGGRNEQQAISIDETTARTLCESYFNHIHILQPFLNRQETYALLEDFIASYCSEPMSDTYTYVPGYVRTESANGIKKRKFEFEGSAASDTSSGDQFPSPAKKPIKRTVQNAVILLIFALGRVCLHKGPLPTPVNPKPSPAAEATMSPPVSTPMSRVAYSSASSGSHSPRLQDELSDAADCMQYQQNIDRLPGAAYFAHAVSILGEVHGGNGLPHVHACLLAGLYLAQFCYVYDSWKWIHSACVAWLVLFNELDDDPDAFLVEPGNPKSKTWPQLEPQLLAFWTCLVLESDILAELQFPPSGISKHEDEMPQPPDYGKEGEEKELRWYYSAQVYLRVTGNRIHSALYNEKDKKAGVKRGWADGASAESLEQLLVGFRSTLLTHFKWDDNDPPAKHINAARLRGKYWGMQNIVNRPYLHQTLARTPDTKSELAQYDQAAQMRAHSTAFNNALKCLESIKRSTLAFDNVPGMHDRLIVTNLFGTAQAQFGNCLVLGAACLSKVTEDNLTPKTLLPYLERTSVFLGHLAHLSPTMRTNLKVLENIKHKVVRKQHREKWSQTPTSAHSSFTA